MTMTKETRRDFSENPYKMDTRIRSNIVYIRSNIVYIFLRVDSSSV